MEDLLKNVLHLMAYNAYLVYKSCLVGDSAPSVRERYHLIKDYKPGDLVMEISKFEFFKDPNELNYELLLNSIGHYIGKEMREIFYEEDEGSYFEIFYYIETLDGRLFQWYNCDFIRILTPNKYHIYTEDECRKSKVELAKLKYNITCNLI